MAKGKLGSQVAGGVSGGAGKLGQQAGAKPTQKEEKKVKRKREELKQTQQRLKGKSLSEYASLYKDLPGWKKEAFTSPEKIKSKTAKQRAEKLSGESEKAKQKSKELQEKLDKKQKQKREAYHKARRNADWSSEQARKIRAEFEEEMSELEGEYKPKIRALREKAQTLENIQKDLKEGKLYSVEQAREFAQKKYESELRREESRAKREESLKEQKLSEIEFGQETGIPYERFKEQYSPGAKADVLIRKRQKKKGISREKAIKELEKEGTLKEPKLTKEQKQKYRESVKEINPNLSPVFAGGKLRGFRDVEKGKSIPKSEFTSETGELKLPVGKEIKYQNPYTGKVTEEKVSPVQRKVEARGKQVVPSESFVSSLKKGTAYVQSPTIQQKGDEFTFRDPTKGKFEEGRVRPATEEEKKILKEKTSKKDKKEDLGFFPSMKLKASDLAREYLPGTDKEMFKTRKEQKQEILQGQQRVEKFNKKYDITEPTQEFLSKAYQYYPTTQISSGVEYLKSGSFEKAQKKKEQTAELQAGFTTAILPTSPKELAGDVALYGVSKAGGVVLGLSGKGIRNIPKVGRVGSGFFKGTTTIAGAGLTGVYTYKTGKEFMATEDYAEKGQVLGSSAKELGLISAGISSGMKSSDVIAGRLSVRGRQKIPIERLTTKDVLSGKKNFPEAPPSQQLKLFQEKGIAYHATGQKFFGRTPKSRTIEPGTGTSELPGLYGSSYVSPHFLRVGKGESIKLPKFKDLFAPEGKPGIAGLQPKGFRKVGYRKAPKGSETPYQFKQPPKEGYADVPGMKTEIEAVFRPGAGKYKFSEGKYYTEVEGVPVKIDKFKYFGGGDTTPTTGKGVKSPTEIIKSYESPITSRRGSAYTSSLRTGYKSVFGESQIRTKESIYTPSTTSRMTSSSIKSPTSIKTQASYLKSSDKFYSPSKERYFSRSGTREVTREAPSEVSNIFSPTSISPASTTSKTPGSSVVSPPSRPPKRPTRRTPFQPEFKPRRRKKPSRRKRREPTSVRRRPSLAAIGLNIRSPISQISKRRERTGLVLRPILIQEKPKKKDKKQTKSRSNIFKRTGQI